MNPDPDRTKLPVSENPFVEARQTADRGIGVFAKRALLAGELVASFDGEIYIGVTADDFPDHAQDYAIQFEETRVRDSKGIARYVNHSCDPNCGIVERFSIVTMKPVAEGEELTWDYDMSENSDWSMRCRCGSANCRRLVMGYRYLPLERRELYRGFISDYLANDDIAILPLPANTEAGSN